MGKRHTYKLCECENENVKFQTKNFNLCEVESSMPLEILYSPNMCILFEIVFCSLTMISCPFDMCIFNIMQLEIEVQQFSYFLHSKQQRKVQVASVMMNKNKTCHVIRILHTFVFVYMFLQYFIFG